MASSIRAYVCVCMCLHVGYSDFERSRFQVAVYDPPYKLIDRYVVSTCSPLRPNGRPAQSCGDANRIVRRQTHVACKQARMHSGCKLFFVCA